MIKLVSATALLCVFLFPFLRKHHHYRWHSLLITHYSLLTTDDSRLTAHDSRLTTDTLLYPDEVHFKNVQQLTVGGDNAEAYWSYDSKYIVFQRTNPKEGLMCDQIFVGKVPQKPGDKFEYKMISTGKGRCTCAFFTKDGKHIIYASTHLGADTCPPSVDRSKYGNKYIWPLYDSYDIFMADLNGKIVKQLTHSKGYDAEGTLLPDGKKMIYTSDKDGDIDLYIMDLKSGKEKESQTPWVMMVAPGLVRMGEKLSGGRQGQRRPMRSTNTRIFLHKI